MSEDLAKTWCERARAIVGLSLREPPPSAATDARARWEKALADIEPDYLQGLKSRPAAADKLRAVMAFAQGKAEAENFDAAVAALEKLAAALRGKSVGVREVALPPDAELLRPVRAGQEPAGMALWQAERARAVAALTRLEEAFRGTDDPERDAAIVLLRAVRANLTAEPATLAQVEELQTYLDTDDVVDAAETPNSFGVTVSLREPLGRALASLREAHTNATQTTVGG